MKSRLKSATILVSGTLGFGLMFGSAMAADIAQECMPAVSGLNGKLEGAGGYIEERDDDGLRFQGVGTLDLPKIDARRQLRSGLDHDADRRLFGLLWCEGLVTTGSRIRPNRADRKIGPGNGTKRT